MVDKGVRGIQPKKWQMHQDREAQKYGAPLMNCKHSDVAEASYPRGE